MTTEAATPGNYRAKFQALLRDLFQFDCDDLDFGIYRIMNHKRDAVKRFIGEKLPEAIDEALATGQLAEQKQAAADLQEAHDALINSLGAGALDADGNLIAFENTPIGRDYLQAKEAAEGARGSSAVEVSIYNHLYTFFSRYYQDGDFISKRRYSRNQRYAIPYNGEEVYLHWANSDQYYVKTDEHFRNYDWNAPNGVSVHFHVQDANVEQNNVQGDRRFFLPVVDGVSWDSDTRSVDIPFEYRPLNDSEKREYGRSKQQDNIINAAASAIPDHIGNSAPDAVSALVGEHRRDGNDESISRLKHHLRRYTQRNDSDFFIHKNLKAFLLRELDFYLKNEVLNLDEISAAGEIAADGWFQQMRLMKDVGGEIIEFLAQVENFQKILWEKKKFVTETQYCVALGIVPEDFHAEIVENIAQWSEWSEIIGIDPDDQCAEFLQSHPTLMLDTSHFCTDFADRLLASFHDLDSVTDGLLIHSENWQALHFLRESYTDGVKCIYIDPPYNTDASPILYKNNYRHSTWASLLQDRLSMSKPFLLDDGVLGCAINDYELKLALGILEGSFPSYDIQPIVVNHYPGSGSGRGNVSSTHEYHLVAVPKNQNVLVGAKRDGGIRTRNFRRSGQGENNFRWGRPNSFFAILVDPASREIKGMEEAIPEGADYPTDNTMDGLLRIYPIGRDGSERVWSRNRGSATQLWQEGSLECTRSNTIVHHIENEGRKILTSVWLDKKFNAVVHGTNLLADILGRSEAFPYPKSMFTVKTAIDAVLNQNSVATVLDYFAGSGTTAHAVIDLNREDGGQRQFILIEMGDYFDTVLLPRVKKVTYTPEWKEGKPERCATPEEIKRSPRIVKYMRLESYEDALDCIEFDADTEQMRLEERIDDYLIKYMLEWETRNSDTLLNVRNLARPFHYKLRSHANGATREQLVDVAETFNYLLGLNVKTRRVYDNNGQRYLVYRGETREAPGKEVTVIWRDTEGWTDEDYERDRKFVTEKRLMDGAGFTYINGASCIPGARELEPMFRDRMFAPVIA